MTKEKFDKNIDTSEILDRYNKVAILSKRDIIESIKINIQYYKNLSETDKLHSSSYYSILIKLLNKFSSDMERKVLFNKLEPGWRYYYILDDEGIALYLEHSVIAENDNVKFIAFDEIYQLHKCNAKLLNVDDYSKIYNVEKVTVRQWIYRGKLKSAKKIGGEWFISELCEYPKKGYKAGIYIWDENKTCFKNGYENFQKFGEARIVQFDEDKNKYSITLVSNDNYETKQINKKEKEKIELMLIENPGVKYLENIKCINYNAKYNSENAL
ncbi:MAG: helix-turn-helix domain-containing protein [Lachnospiraceae bacterium]|nr:helix-turn-helix domain-containing protein [Lachnospiraceae bacterium]